MPGQGVEILVVVQNGDSGANGDGGDEAVQQLADGFALLSAAAVEVGGAVIVRCLHRYNRRLR